MRQTQDIGQYFKRGIGILYTNIKSKTTRQGTVWAVTTFDILSTDYLLMGIDSLNTQTDWKPPPSPSDIPPDIELRTFRNRSRGIQPEAISHSNEALTITQRAEVRALEFSHLPPAMWKMLRVELRMKKESLPFGPVRMCGTCRKQKTNQSLQVLFPRGFFLYIAHSIPSISQEWLDWVNDLIIIIYYNHA